MSGKWYEFYNKRINSSYQRYFEFKYSPFLLYILSQMKDKDIIVDAGCGIGSVTKFLFNYKNKNKKQKLVGYDIDPDMVHLAKLNNPMMKDSHFYEGNLVAGQGGVREDALSITHGVLEHYPDHIIWSILDANPGAIHYVPLDKYETPSFRDERLLSAERWIDTFKPSYHFKFNNGYDFCFRK